MQRSRFLVLIHKSDRLTPYKNRRRKLTGVGLWESANRSEESPMQTMIGTAPRKKVSNHALNISSSATGASIKLSTMALRQSISCCPCQRFGAKAGAMIAVTNAMAVGPANSPKAFKAESRPATSDLGREIGRKPTDKHRSTPIKDETSKEAALPCHSVEPMNSRLLKMVFPERSFDLIPLGRRV